MHYRMVEVQWVKHPLKMETSRTLWYMQNAEKLNKDIFHIQTLSSSDLLELKTSDFSRSTSLSFDFNSFLLSSI